MSPHEVAARVVPELVRRGLTVATAESLTGGLVCAALTSVPGASAVVRGGVVAYASDVKASVLGVDAEVLAALGAVCAPVAEQLATGVGEVVGCDVGLSTTGVAGPDPADGQPVGTVFVGAAGPWGILVEQHALTGDREQVRAASVDAVLTLLERGLRNLRDAVGAGGYGGSQHEPADDEREEAP
ncbi:CinA family protein [Oryzobacter terrae]|uniref:CinA family protein n=1 Tax=Oryzobacter terrae TaxID=1620385 RepID=UPI00366BE3FF